MTLLDERLWTLFRRNWRQTLTYWSVFFSFGLCIALLGPTILDLRCQTQSSLQQITWVFFSQQFFLLVGSSVGGLFKKTATTRTPVLIHRGSPCGVVCRVSLAVASTAAHSIHKLARVTASNVNMFSSSPAAPSGNTRTLQHTDLVTGRANLLTHRVHAQQIYSQCRKKRKRGKCLYPDGTRTGFALETHHFSNSNSSSSNNTRLNGSFTELYYK
ncbi:major facilitator superfamily domain-containing 4A-like [Solea senegalensis]|uniref:Major facilitator superfamily domain-containing 4A-like n=1 Tax=Solea senegalensis TaxID=28829 RepID=A0AAV6QTQ4_SOLSE|nr:major facilitator superfamily domain-containing 4A-like [Solea senegalensis]